MLGAEARWLGHGGSSWSRRRRDVAQDGVGGAALLEARHEPLAGRVRREGGGASD